MTLENPHFSIGKTSTHSWWIGYIYQGTKCQAQPCGCLSFSGQTHARALCSSWCFKVNTSGESLGNRFPNETIRKTNIYLKKMVGNGRHDPFLQGSYFQFLQGRLLLVLRGCYPLKRTPKRNGQSLGLGCPLLENKSLYSPVNQRLLKVSSSRSRRHPQQEEDT